MVTYTTPKTGNQFLSVTTLSTLVFLMACVVVGCEQADDTGSGGLSTGATFPEGMTGDTLDGSNVWEGPEQGLDGVFEGTTTELTDTAEAQSHDAGATDDDHVEEIDDAANMAGGGSELRYPAIPANSGTVILYEYRSTTPSFVIGNATAYFGYEAKETEPKAVYASCHVAKAVAPPSVLPSLPSWDAGNLVISGTMSPIRLRYSDANINNPGYQCSLPVDHGELFHEAGAPVTITGTGGDDVGPFEAVVSTPAPIELLAPPLGLTKPISTDLPLTIQWTADPEATSVVVTLVGLDNLYNVIPGESVNCVVDGDTGALAVPADAMKQLPKDFGTNLGIAVTRFHKSVVVVNNLPINLVIARATAGVAKAQ
ncbi:MAG: hypothetical protein HUU55_14225 [Myxococcales bacterium]|nr:hypothetical protein [Myxococcales bacterium]